MNWLGGGETALGFGIILVASIILWALKGDGTKPLSPMRFAIWPSILILAYCLGFAMIMSGAGWM